MSADTAPGQVKVYHPTPTALRCLRLSYFVPIVLEQNIIYNCGVA